MKPSLGYFMSPCVLLLAALTLADGDKNPQIVCFLSLGESGLARFRELHPENPLPMGELQQKKITTSLQTVVMKL